MAELYERLEEYRDSDYYPFHMPGHKRNGNMVRKALINPYGLDITEIDGFDNLHQAEGILKREQEKAARMYGAEKSYFLVNGSTGGILSAIGAVTERGGRLLIGRNCHKSVYHGAYLQELKISYLYPELLKYGVAGAISPDEVEQKLKEQPDIGAILITSPTYEGIVSDIGEIAAISHRYGKPLVVDEAHGAHFGFHSGYPENGVRLGADIVIHSLHKTLPSMTQTALLHVKGNLVDRRKLERYLHIFQTSSPSYVLMASMSNCLEVVENEGWQLLEKLKGNRERLEEKLKGCNYITIHKPEGIKNGLAGQGDICKLIVGIKEGRLTGQQLYDILRQKYHLQMEMAAGNYVLAILTIMDTEEGLDRLAGALLEIDRNMDSSDKVKRNIVEGERSIGGEDKFVREGQYIDIKEEECTQGIKNPEISNLEMKSETVMPIYQAYDKEQELILVKKGCGRIAAEFIHLYPPGIPLVVPGERMDGGTIKQIMDYMSMGLTVQGIKDGCIRVLKGNAKDKYSGKRKEKQ